MRHHLALWDVIKSCDIKGSSDASIKNITPNDINMIVKNSDIRLFVCNGQTSAKYFKKYFPGYINKMVVLPSTSPANAAYSLERLIDNYSILLNF